MNSTPNVFIMSSNAGHNLAEAFAAVLARGQRIDVRTWKAGDFRGGDPFIDTLQRTTIQYDFGINLLTPDDSTQVRSVAQVEPRDNVVFELGLFLGARGRWRAFPLPVSVAGVAPSIPSDLMGVKHYGLEVDRLDRTVNEFVPLVERQAEEMAARIQELYARPQITILPSTGLAIGYFQNFILPVMKGLRATRRVTIMEGSTSSLESVDLNTVMLTVCIPDQLREATRENWRLKGDALKLAQGQVDPSDDPELPRAYPFRLHADVSGGRLKIYDTPTTLLTAQHVVRRLLPDPSYGKADRDMAEEREIHNFELTVRALLDEPEHNWFAQRVVFVPWSAL